MKNKSAAAAIAAVICLSACGADDERLGSDAGYIAVYQELTQVPVTEITDTFAEAQTPAADTHSGYLENVMLIGDETCGAAYDNGYLQKPQVISIDGAYPDNILRYKINGELVSDIIKSADMPYIYILFDEQALVAENTAEEYGSKILCLSEQIRELCPKSTVIALSKLPERPDSEICDKIDEYNDMLKYCIRSTPDEYIIFMDITYSLKDKDGYLRADFDNGGNISADGMKAVIDVIDRDRFYNDMTEDSDNMYSHIIAERPPYVVTEGKTAYLTFDDGPSKYTPQILQILADNDIKATFFITGWCIRGNEDILKSVADNGHTIGLHSYSHNYDEIYSSSKAWLDDFAAVYGKIYAVTGKKPWAFRFPGGSYNNYNKHTSDEIIAQMNSRGFIYYDWNAATADASTEATYDSCMEHLENSLGSGHEVVLMHDSLELTSEYLQDAIDLIKSKGYSFETIDTADAVQF